MIFENSMRLLLLYSIIGAVVITGVTILLMLGREREK